MSEQPEVLFVAPNSIDEGFLGDIRRSGKAHAIPNLGILSVATYLEQEGVRVEVLDAERDLLTEDETVKTISEILREGGKVGWATWINTIERTARMAAKLRELRPELGQFIGGPHVSATPIKTMERFGDRFDYAVNGEGELATVEIVNNWDNPEYLRDRPGIIVSRDRKLYYTKTLQRGYVREVGKQKTTQTDELYPTKADRVEDLNSLPIPKYEMLGDLTKYHLSEFTRKTGEFQLPMMTSRGCPYTCSFCDQEVSGHTWRGLTPDNAVNHMKYLKRLGVTYFYLTDDLYLVRQDEVEETARLILATPELKDCTWEAITRANLAHIAAQKKVNFNGHSMNLLELISQAGCRVLHVAPETGNEKLRFDAINKKIPNREIEDSVVAMAAAEIDVKLLNMVGLPGETPAHTLETLQFIKKLGNLGAAYAMIAICTPLPTTELAIRIEGGQLKWTGDLEDWSKMNLWDAAGIFTTDKKGNNVNYTPENILLASRGKHRLGKLVTPQDQLSQDTIEQKIARVSGLVEKYSQEQKKYFLGVH